MLFKNIQQYSLFYKIASYYINFWHNKIFYKTLCVTGKNNIPENEPLIIVANHQNGLMDPLAIICTHNWQPVFLARSDIFRNPLIAKLLIRIKMLPVYRLRDGKEAVKKNEEIFKINVEILKQKKILALMPEASHEGVRRLRTIQKGVSRIAFQAEEEANYNLNLKILIA